MFIALLLVIINLLYVNAIHITGTWRSNTNYKIVSRFGFQKTDLLHVNQTRGYIFGNITSNNFPVDKSPPVLFVLVNYAHFKQMYDVLQEPKTGIAFCQRILHVISDMSFEPRCNSNGKQDVFRHLPCPREKLCSDEDQPAGVFPRSQLTYRVQDLAQARFWYIFFVSCYRDQNCSWTSHDRLLNFSLDYDLFLVNGHPDNRSVFNFFDKWHFSVDDEDLGQMSVVALLANLLLLTLEVRAYRLQKTDRGIFLLWILGLQSAKLGLSCAHWALLGRDGRGLGWAEALARHCLAPLVDYGIVLLLVLIAKGWKVRTNKVLHRTRTACTILVFLTAHATFYFWAVASAEWWFETCVFDLWQGWVILLIRIFAMCWFFVELRQSIKMETNDQKKMFLLHFGSGFLVWFVYMAVVGAFSSRIPIMSRKLTIEGLTQLANFVALAVLTHLFHPRSQNRWFFLNPVSQLELDDELAARLDSPRPSPTTKGDPALTMDDLDGVWRVTDASKPS